MWVIAKALTMFHQVSFKFSIRSSITSLIFENGENWKAGQPVVIPSATRSQADHFLIPPPSSNPRSTPGCLPIAKNIDIHSEVLAPDTAKRYDQEESKTAAADSFPAQRPTPGRRAWMPFPKTTLHNNTKVYNGSPDTGARTTGHRARVGILSVCVIRQHGPNCRTLRRAYFANSVALV